MKSRLEPERDIFVNHRDCPTDCVNKWGSSFVLDIDRRYCTQLTTEYFYIDPSQSGARYVDSGSLRHFVNSLALYYNSVEVLSSSSSLTVRLENNDVMFVVKDKGGVVRYYPLQRLEQ